MCVSADMQYYSHIEKGENGDIVYRKLLRDHLREVAEASRNYILQMPIESEERSLLADIAYVIGIAHDLGKFTTYFQQYLTEDRDSGIAKNHSFISALWGMFVLPQILVLEKDQCTEALLLLFSSILYHHGNLDTFKSWLEDLVGFHDPIVSGAIDPHRKRMLSTLHKKQLPDIEKQASRIDQELELIHPTFPTVEELVRAVRDSSSGFYDRLMTCLDTIEMWMESGRCDAFHRKLYVLFSALIDADKRDAAKVAKEIERRGIPPTLVENFIAGTTFQPANSKLLHLRKTLFHSVDHALSDLSIQNRIFTLTAPTGSGKTLTALNLALKLRRKIEMEKGYIPRIIYALPFTSIIDQNHEVFETVLQSLQDFERNASVYLLKHHHLAEIEYRSEALPEDHLPLDQALMLIESWESEIVVTTFVQLLNSLIGNRNRLLKKYHNIAGSILILDEVQNISVEYWPLLRDVLRVCANQLGCTVVLMTATQPLIFEPEEAVEIVPHAETLFSLLDRIEIHANLNPISLSEFAAEFVASLDPQKSYAVILNTIKSSIDFYQEIMRSDPSQEVFYLSTNILPIHRRERIERIQSKLSRGEPVILISTQVIEAGVDLDFDVIFRDLAPIDSIVQSAGRANRNWRKDRGEVHVVHLQDQEGRSFARWIYGKQHLAISHELLANVKRVKEKNFYELVKENYRQLVRKTDLSAGIRIFRDWWLRGDFAALDDFRLIDYRGEYYDVFIEINEPAKMVWRRFQDEVLKERDFSQRQRNYLSMRRDLRQYVLSIPHKFIKAHFWDYCGGRTDRLGYIEAAIWQQYYDLDTGFKRSQDEEAMIL